MKRRNVRVILATEHPKTLDFLREAVEQEEGAVVVGEAENAAKAVSLTKNLRPDIAIVDSYLPYVVGLDDVPLSRIGGLDAAQTIVERTPKTRVVLLNNLDPETLVSRDFETSSAVFAMEKMDSTIPFTLRELQQQPFTDNGVVFANLDVSPRRGAQQAGSNLIFGGMFLGGAALLTGWALIIALWLVPAGVYLAAAGAGVLLLSLAGKLALSLRPKLRLTGRKARESD